MTITEELRAVEREARAEFGHRWHLYLGRDHGKPTGNVWAVTPHSPCGGSGTTLQARTPALMRGEIADTEWHWAHAGSWA